MNLLSWRNAVLAVSGLALFSSNSWADGAHLVTPGSGSKKEWEQIFHQGGLSGKENEAVGTTAGNISEKPLYRTAIITLDLPDIVPAVDPRVKLTSLEPAQPNRPELEAEAATAAGIAIEIENRLSFEEEAPPSTPNPAMATVDSGYEKQTEAEKSANTDVATVDWAVTDERDTTDTLENENLPLPAGGPADEALMMTDNRSSSVPQPVMPARWVMDIETEEDTRTASSLRRIPEGMLLSSETTSEPPQEQAGERGIPSTTMREIALPIRFSFDSSRLSAKSKGDLTGLAQAMTGSAFQHLIVEIEGHTDTSGPAWYNMRLSKKRARKVREYLAKNGVASERMSIEAKGESELLSGYRPRHSYQRRVEFKFRSVRQN